jgi:hypothetical protein
MRLHPRAGFAWVPRAAISLPMLAKTAEITREVHIAE